MQKLMLNNLYRVSAYLAEAKKYGNRLIAAFALQDVKTLHEYGNESYQ